MGMVKEGKRADLLLTDGRPDKDITDISKIKTLWIGGKPGVTTAPNGV